MSNARWGCANTLRAWTLGAAIILSPPASADGLSAGDAPGATDCGGDAYSSAQVVEGRRSHRGPIEVTPQTLCADLAPQRLPGWDAEAYPLVAPPIGGGRHRAPYEGRQR